MSTLGEKRKRNNLVDFSLNNIFETKQRHDVSISNIILICSCYLFSRSSDCDPKSVFTDDSNVTWKIILTCLIIN